MLEGGADAANGSDNENGTTPTEATDSLELEPPHTQIPTAAAWITGRATYKPDFYTLDFSTSPPSGDSMDNSYAGRGRVPSADSSYSVMRYLFICAYEQDGSVIDFQTNAESDDDLLGCDQADMFGRYSIPIERAGQDDDVYLVTTFCDNPQVSTTVPGTSVTYDDVPEVCIRPNKAISSQSWNDMKEVSGGDAGIKYLTTRIHTNTLAATGETRISWNLSCPQQNGYKPSDPQYDPVICTGSGDGVLEPTETIVPDGTVKNWDGDKNSNLGHNKEFVHMYVSMIENYRWYGTYKPDSTNALGGGECTSSACQGIVYVYACDTYENWTPYEDPGVTGADCGAVTKTAQAITMNHRCPVSNAPIGTCGDLNPHVVAHELGHIMQFRWGQVNGAAKDTERGMTMEGWADFVALATWYEADDADSPNTDDPHFNDPTFVAESPSSFSGANWTDDSCGSGNSCGCSEGNLYGGNEGESRETMFFWDLYDTATDGGSDNVSEDFVLIRSHWNLFNDVNSDGDKFDDHENKECEPSPDVCPGDDGVNLEDYQWWWDEVQPLTGVPSISGLMTANCTDRHTDGRNCTDTTSTCDHIP